MENLSAPVVKPILTSRRSGSEIESEEASPRGSPRMVHRSRNALGGSRDEREVPQGLRPDVLQAMKEQRATNEAGHFDPEAMYEIFSRSPSAVQLEREVHASGEKAGLAGYTDPPSSGYTLTNTGAIRIRKTHTPDWAAMTYGFELHHAKNRHLIRARDEHVQAAKDLPDRASEEGNKAYQELRKKYIDTSIEFESKAALGRVKLSAEMGILDQLTGDERRRHHVEIYQKHSDPKAAQAAMEDYMRKDAVVFRGTTKQRPVVQHYGEQFDESVEKE